MPYPLISIIVPCYNQAEYLDECLQSVLNQSYIDWECMIIDDGSPDNTEEISQKWIKKDSRFNYFRKENGGVASARNFGIEKSKGEWILPLDGDDKIGESYISDAVKISESGYDLIYSSAECFGIENRKFAIPEYSFRGLLKNNIIFCSALFKREYLHDLRYDENLKHGLEDWEFWISYISQNKIRVLKLKETHFFYRIKETSRNQSIKSNKNKTSEAELYILNKHKKLYDEIYGDYFTVIRKLAELEYENNYFQKIVHSKKYKFITKIIKIVNKLKFFSSIIF